MPLFETRLNIPATAVEMVDMLLLELEEQRWSVLHDSISGKAWIVGIFEDEARARLASDELSVILNATGLPSLNGQWKLRELEDRDWKESYKDHFKASHFGPLHWAPIWEKESFTLPEGEVVIWLDPGLAFGTGNHETTRLCCERLVALSQQLSVEQLRETKVIDAGTGSGILALSAVRLGFGEIAAFDNDPEAVRVSKENAELNELAGRVDFYEGDLISGLVDRKADLVMANIQSDILMRYAGELIKAVASRGTLVLSGILSREIDDVKTAFIERVPMWEVDSRVMGEWADLMLKAR